MGAAEAGRDRPAPRRSSRHGPEARTPRHGLVSSIGAALGVAAALPLLVGVFFVPAIMAAAAGYGPPGFLALVTALVLLVLAAGELLLQRNYASADQPRTWPRQPVSPALLTTAILSLLIFLVVLVVTAYGNSLLGQHGGWIPSAILSAAAVASALPAYFAARRRHGIQDAAPGLDAALRAITVYRIARTLAAMLDSTGRLAARSQQPCLGRRLWRRLHAVHPVVASLPRRITAGRRRCCHGCRAGAGHWRQPNASPLPCLIRASFHDGGNFRGPRLGSAAI